MPNKRTLEMQMEIIMDSPWRRINSMLDHPRKFNMKEYYKEINEYREIHLRYYELTGRDYSPEKTETNEDMLV